MAMAISYGFISKTGSKQHKEAALAMKHGVTSHVSYKISIYGSLNREKRGSRWKRGHFSTFPVGYPTKS